MAPEYITTPSRAAEVCATLARHRLLGVDIETAALPAFAADARAGLDPYRSRVRLVSVAAPDGVYVFDMDTLHPSVLTPLAAVPWVAHNAVFEYRHMKRGGYALSSSLHDTQLLGRLIYRECLSLADLSQKVLGIAVDKTLQTSNWNGTLSKAQIHYAANDAVLALQLAVALRTRPGGYGYWLLYDLYRALVPVIGSQMLAGMSMDWQHHTDLIVQWTAERDALREQLQELLGNINYRSPKQLSEWLERHLPADVLARWPRTDSGTLSSSATILAHHAELPMVRPLLRYKATEKLLGTYGAGYAKFRHPVTDRLHPDVLIAGTAGGRFACRNPNVQNPPRDKAFRSVFAVAPGRVLVAADFSQIELRVAALLSKDTRMLNAYAEGQDLHRLTAAALSGVSIGNVTPEQRQAAKAINFGNLYQQRPTGLALYARNSYGVTMTVQEAAQAQARFFAAYPDLYRWQLQQIQSARTYGKVRTRTGLVREFTPGIGYIEAEACNYPIQGSAGEILLAALKHLDIAGIGATLYNHVHDEILLDVPADRAEQAALELQRAMVAGFLEVFPEGEGLTNGLVEVKQGHSWAEVK